MIYLSSPHTHKSYQARYTRYIQVVQYTAWLCDQGVLVFSPIAHSKIISTFRKETSSFAMWKAFDLSMVRRCDAFGILMLEGWDQSQGIGAELVEALDCEHPVIYFRWKWMAEDNTKALRSVLVLAGQIT